MIGALAVSVALAACPAGTPAAMRLEGVPTTLVSGRSYTASLAATGVGEAVGGFIYTRARVGARRYVIDCPIV